MSGVKREREPLLLLSYQGLLIETKTKKPGFSKKPGFLATGDDIIERVGFLGWKRHRMKGDRG